MIGQQQTKLLGRVGSFELGGEGGDDEAAERGVELVGRASGLGVVR